MEARVLYLDDSGKPDGKHSSGAVVIAGLAMDAVEYAAFSRRVLGAKRKYFPSRGGPQDWEIKSSNYIRNNEWKRANNRNFVAEMIRIARSNGATSYSVCMDKSKMMHPMTLETSMPLQLQALVEHFDAECRQNSKVGLVVVDTSSHQLDQHASKCVSSFVVSRRLGLHPVVYYAGSKSCEAIQVADLFAAIRRRSLEGDVNLALVDEHVAALRPNSSVVRTFSGRSFTNRIDLF
jgi:hypothetical protein